MQKPKSLRETLEEHRKAEQHWAAMHGKPLRADLPAVPPKKIRSKAESTDKSMLEAAVMKDVGSVIAGHNNVLFAVRQNSGAAMIGNVPVWFYKWAKRSGVNMTITDFWGLLNNGRMFAIEVKKREWKKISSDREQMQDNFIKLVQSAGGVGGFVVCREDAERILSEERIISL